MAELRKGRRIAMAATKHIPEKYRKLALAILGALIFAAGMNLFIVPINLFSGGFLGVGQIVRTILVNYAHIPIPPNVDIAGIILYIINVPLLVLAYRSMGRWFFICTLITVTLQTVFLTVIPTPVDNPILTDPLAAAFVGGVIAGYGSGLILVNGSCGGGQDILGLYFMKKDRSFSVGKISMAINIVVFAACALMFDLTTVVYSLIYVAIYSYVIDHTHAQNQNMAAVIVTTNGDVLPAIQRETDRSFTHWDGMGYYSHKGCHVIFMALSRYESMKIGSVIKEIDAHAFVTFFNINTIVGNYDKHL